MDNRALVSNLSVKLGKSRSDVTKLLEGLSQVVTACVCDLDGVAIPGFGSFEPKKTDEYIAVNSETGRRTLYPPRVEIVFNPSILLKKKIGKSHE